MHSLGRDCHFNLSFCKRFPLCMQAKVWRYLSTTWEMGYIFFASCYTKAGMHSLFFIRANEIFVRDRGIFAHMICFFLLEMDE
jgi:hypothetical protein